jgi:hypothetical protein
VEYWKNGMMGLDEINLLWVFFYLPIIPPFHYSNGGAKIKTEITGKFWNGQL